MLVAIKPEYQGKGVNSLLFYDLLPIYIQEGYEYVETNVELETNAKVQQQWIYFERRQHKRRRCFKKTLKEDSNDSKVLNDLKTYKWKN